MNEFNGFPARMEFTPVPNIFLSNLLPEITDAVELKLTLHLFHLLYFKKGTIKFITFNEMENDAGLMGSIKTSASSPEETLRQALAAAVLRKTILHIAAEDGNREDIYLLNTKTNRETVEKIRNGEIHLTGLATKHITPEILTEKQPNIFTLYEENVGLLTLLIGVELCYGKNHECLNKSNFTRRKVKRQARACVFP